MGMGSDSDELATVANPNVCAISRIAKSKRYIVSTSLVLCKIVYYKPQL